MRVLVTGAAGFIGFHLSQRLLAMGHKVTGLDNLSDYYDVALKKDRLGILRDSGEKFSFVQADISDAPALADAFSQGQFTHVVNLAAQAGVRYSLEKPASYVQANLVGFANLLEQCRQHRVAHLVYASSSSVYGLNGARPYSTNHNVDHPVSLYAATKKSNELMAHSYSHLFHIPTTGLRFFTVYGPWGRPDMALYLFTRAILHNEPVKLFNHGHLQRDFTYIDDIVEGIVRVLERPASINTSFDPLHPDPSSSSCPWRIYNIGNNHTVRLADFISTLEKALGMRARIDYLPMQPGDVESTWADIADLQNFVHFKPSTPLAKGIETYVDWHRNYYGDK